MSQVVYGLVFGVYALGLMALAYYESRGVEDSSDYMIAGGSLKSSVAGVSELFSSFSGFWLIGITGFAYLVGSWAWIAILGQATGWVIMYYGVAERLKRSSEVIGEETLPAYLGKMYDSKSVLVVSSLSLLLFETTYVSSQISAGAKAMTPFFDLSWELSAIIMGTIITVYTVAGGFKAVAFSDFIQGILVVLGTVVFVIWTMLLVGGPVILFNRLSSIDPMLVSFTGGSEGFVLFSSLMNWGFIGMYYFGSPHSLIRFFAIDESSNVRSAMVWSGFAQLIVAVAAVFVGLSARVLLEGPLLADEELAFSTLAIAELTPVAAAFMLAAVVGLLMSTGDSQLLMSATTVSRDLYERALDKDITDQKSKRIARISVLALGLIATAIASFNISSVLQIVIYAWAGLGATFGPAIFASLWWKNTTSQGIVTGMIVALLTTILAYIFIGSSHPILITWNIWPMVLSFVTIYLVSKYTHSRTTHEDHIQRISVGRISTGQDDD
ncbi:sodium/proline symporter (plasmid) [Natrinema zhouii]|uniref:sodium/proline symporter n=1 Tax=Natrinema zhouii TaxID=1710539 RepID=UPI001CFFB5DB|nr:sodium/proline symporter [Natrinema zhouii]UHQ98257.1 sodium/proline symporter [Natrinema zhouii]